MRLKALIDGELSQDGTNVSIDIQSKKRRIQYRPVTILRLVKKLANKNGVPSSKFYQTSLNARPSVSEAVQDTMVKISTNQWKGKSMQGRIGL